MTEFIVVLATAPEAEAERIARALVERGLCACVNIIGGVSSIYRWKGSIESGAEAVLLMKTTAALQEHLYEALRGLHPYEVPEFIVLPIVGGSDEYLNWLRGE